MKNFKNLTLAIVLGFGITVVSCSKDATTTVDEEQDTAIGIDQDVLAKAQSLHFNTFDMQETSFEKPNGKIEEGYLLEGDIFMTRDQLMNMQGGDTPSKQYSTNNLVSQGTTINILGYTPNNSSQALTSKMQTALQWAVNNYNRLNINISFSLTYGTNWQAADMVVYRTANGQAGGVAGFPSNGNPNKFIQIFSGMDNYDTNTNEHVITHEIGHSVGFRHTDWFSRQSCGQNSNEGTAGVGANRIPGTPSGFDSTSIMLACFSANEDGEFNNNDITALNFLY